MLQHRVLAVSPVKAIRKTISVGLMSAGSSVDQFESLGELKPGPISDTILVIHIEDSIGTALIGSVCERLDKSASLIAIVPASDIETTVAVMQASSKVACVLVAEGLTSATVARAASKLLYGDIFGLEKMVPWGCRVYSTLVGSYHEKNQCINQISDFAKAMGVRRKYRDAIEQCADEMLMNALYDAPVDADGKPLFSEIPIKERIKIEVEQKPVVQYACSDQVFMFSVRDAYGTLTRNTVLQYLDKCLHAEQQIDRKTGGAGLGLYLMASQSTQLVFNVLPGVATECICTFDLLAPKVQLTDMSMFFERIDARGRLSPGPPTILPGGVGFPVERRAQPESDNRAVLWGLSAAIALLVALIGLVAYPRFVGTTGEVRIATEPAGARITLDGRDKGTTASGPLLVDLELGSSYQIKANLEGWSEASGFVKPEQGKTTDLLLKLVASSSTVTASTEPSGAEVRVNGELLGITPLKMTELEPGAKLPIAFSKDGYTTRKQILKVPDAGHSSEVSVALVLNPNFGSVDIVSDPPGARIVLNGQVLAGLKTPVSNHLVPAATKHMFTLLLEGYQPAQISARLGRAEQGHELSATLEPGGSLSVSSNIPGTVTVEGAKKCRELPVPMRHCALAQGSYRARLDSEVMNIRHRFTFDIKNNMVSKELQFGVIESSGNHRILLASGRKVKRLAVPAGSHTIKLFNKGNDEISEKRVEIEADQKLKVP